MTEKKLRFDETETITNVSKNSILPLDAESTMTESLDKAMKQFSEGEVEITQEALQIFSDIANRLQADISTRQIDLSKDYGETNFLLEVNGVFSLPTGDIQGVKAHAKEGKTMFITILAAILLGYKDIGGWRCTKKGCKVVYIDTEQHPRNTYRTVRRVHTLCGISTEESIPQFKAYSLREYSIDERLSFIVKVVLEERPDVLIIDGIRDLVTSINSEEESIKLIQLLMAMAVKFNIAIINVLHKNKGNGSNDTMRGHLGAELENKASDVWNVSKKGDIITVSESECRNQPTPDFYFRIDENGTPEPVAEDQAKQQKQSHTSTKEKITDKRIFAFFQTVTTPLTKTSDLYQRVGDVFAVGNPTVREIVKKAEENNWTIVENGKYRGNPDATFSR